MTSQNQPMNLSSDNNSHRITTKRLISLSNNLITDLHLSILKKLSFLNLTSEMLQLHSDTEDNVSMYNVETSLNPHFLLALPVKSFTPNYIKYSI